MSFVAVLVVAGVAFVAAAAMALRSRPAEARLLLPIAVMGLVMVGNMFFGDRLPPSWRLPIFVVAMLGCLLWQRLETARWHEQPPPDESSDAD